MSDKDEVEKILRANTWWKLKTRLEETLLGIEKEQDIEKNWETRP